MAPGICEDNNGLVLVSLFPFSSRCNRVDKRFYRPTEPINRWAFVVFESQQRFRDEAVAECIHGLVSGCKEVGKCYQIRVRFPV